MSKNDKSGDQQVLEHMAAIGLAVIQDLMPDDDKACNQATPENVVSFIQRMRADGERYRIQSETLGRSREMETGRHLIGLYNATFGHKL